jgi:hypothetical protein
MLKKILANKNILIVIFCLITLLIFLIIAPPEHGGGFTKIDTDTDTPTFANYARNLINLPFSVTRGLAVHAISSNGDFIFDGLSNYTWYVNHPPALVWVVAFFMKILGKTLFVARLASIVPSVLIMFFLLQISKKYKYGIIICFFSLIGIPLYLEHGLVPGYQTLTMSFLTASLYFFSKYLDQKNKIFFYLSILFWVFSLVCDWPGYFLSVCYFFYFFKKKKYQTALLIILTSIIFYFILVGYDSYVTSGNFYGPISRPVSLLSSDPVQSIFVTIKNIVKWFLRNYRFIILFFIIGLFCIYKKDINISQGDQFFLYSFFVIGSFNIIIFYNWAGTHSYWSYYYLPSIAIISSMIYNFLFSNNFFLRVIKILFFITIILFSNFYNVNKLLNYKNHKLDQYTTEPLIKFAKEKDNIFFSNSEKFYWWHGHVLKWYIDKKLTSYNKEKHLKNILKEPEKYFVVLRTAVFQQIPENLKDIFIKSKDFDVYYIRLDSDRIGKNNLDNFLKKIFMIID